jgi:exosortase A-associated hydrolase 2
LIAAPATGPFFHRIADQERFWFFHAPAATTMRGSVLAVHAFAEEMNKTRAATADGARALAAAGFAVLQIDLTGCGDSAGEFEDATWAGWMSDLRAGWAWLAERSSGPRWLWGTRLGALLAEQFASQCAPGADGLLLWQPVVSGAQHLNQFLRLKTVNSLLRNDKPTFSPAASIAAPSPRADLAAGRSVEIAGYSLNPVLADAIESAQMGKSERLPARVRWFEVSSQPSAVLSPIATRVVERWRAAGSDVEVGMVAGSAFWQTIEIERCDALVAASVTALCA